MASEKETFTNGLLRERIHKTLSIYSEKSSISGISFIKQSKYPAVRILWSILLVVALIALVVHLTLLFLQYYSFGKHSVTSLNFDVFPFPAVTFCNANPIRKSKVHLASDGLRELVTRFNPKSIAEWEMEMQELVRRQGGDSSDTNLTDDELARSFSSVAGMFKGQMELLRNINPVNFLDLIFEEFNVNDLLDRSKGNDTLGWYALDIAKRGTSPSQDGNTDGTQVSRSSKLAQAFRTLLANNTIHTRANLGHTLDDLLVHCSYAGKPCKASDFTPSFSNFYGSCYTLKSGDFVVTKNGPLAGLELYLYLQGHERIPGISYSKGGQVVVHQPGTVPAPYDQGFAVSAGAQTMVGLRMHDISRLGKPYGNCVTTWKSLTDLQLTEPYTLQTCQKLYSMLYIHAECGCIHPSDVPFQEIAFNGTDNKRTCLSKKERECAETSHQRISEKYEEIYTKCHNPCREKVYTKLLSSRLWPDDGFAYEFVSYVCRNLNETECNHLKSRTSAGSVREEFLKVSIYFEDLNYQQTEDIPDYEVVNLLSDVGGTIGLWIGLSLVNLFEMLHLLVSLGLNTCLFGFKRHFTKEDDPSPQAVPLTNK